MRVFVRAFVLLSTLVFAQLSLWAVPDEIRQRVPKFFIIEMDTGRIIAQQNPDFPHPPASLTKMVGLFLAMHQIQSGRLGWNDLVPIGENTEASAMPPDSSLMFLEAGTRVELIDILRGLAVVSGNDASHTLANFLSGDVPSFIDEMNQLCRNLGFDQLSFVDPSGYDSRNTITARQMARFLEIYVNEFPETLRTLHAVPEMTFPTNEHLPAGFTSRFGPIRQLNRNGLVRKYSEVDGLKTGYIEASGFNLAYTAEKNGFRTLAVLLGIQAPSIWEGVRDRDRLGERVFNWTYSSFELRAPRIDTMEIPLFKAEVDSITTKAFEIEERVLSQTELDRLTVEYKLLESVSMPLYPDSVLGTAQVFLDGNELMNIQLVPESIPEPSPWYVQIWESIFLFFKGVFQGGWTLDGNGLQRASS